MATLGIHDRLYLQQGLAVHLSRRRDLCGSTWKGQTVSINPQIFKSPFESIYISAGLAKATISSKGVARVIGTQAWRSENEIRRF